jgi:hypothetical protein
MSSTGYILHRKIVELRIANPGHHEVISTTTE